MTELIIFHVLLVISMAVAAICVVIYECCGDDYD
jgi:hypothetical protein